MPTTPNTGPDTTPKQEVTPGGFSEAVTTYHDRLSVPLEEWTPRRPERPEKSGLSKPLRVVSDYEPSENKKLRVVQKPDRQLVP